MNGLISVAEADARLQRNLNPTPSVKCPLAKAAGRILREDIRADRDLPPFDRCMLDGYAVRAAEAQAGATFTTTTRVHAGETTVPLSADPLSAVEIMTGSVLPPGADAVIRYEDTEPTPNGFRYTDTVALEPGEGVHPQASDYPEGSILLKAGATLGPVECGIAASCGYAEPLCSQQPRITIFGTGDELVPVTSTPAPHQLRQSNLHAVENALALAGFHVGQVSRLSDDREAEEPRLAQALSESDIVVISGAVSKGRRDWIPAALDALSAKVFHGVALRPGKPMGFWKKASGPAIFGLPGNPVSTLVMTHRFVLPYLRAGAGTEEAHRHRVLLAEDFTFAPALTLFLPFAFDSQGRAVPRPVNNSGDYAGLAGTDGFLELPAGETHWPAGVSFPYTLWQR